jgi:hypothetical protein
MRFGELQLVVLLIDLIFYLQHSSGVADSYRRWIVRLHLAVDLMDDRAFDFRGRAKANRACDGVVRATTSICVASTFPLGVS